MTLMYKTIWLGDVESRKCQMSFPSDLKLISLSRCIYLNKLTVTNKIKHKKFFKQNGDIQILLYSKDLFSLIEDKKLCIFTIHINKISIPTKISK